jgi:O-phospho-L-seryl-tRNASec:L-selenocysteinyl-tRNA synthase
VTGKEKKVVAGIAFEGYGAHIEGYPTAYATAACALGLTRGEVDLFLTRLDKTLTELRQKTKKTEPTASDCPPPHVVPEGS